MAALMARVLGGKGQGDGAGKPILDALLAGRSRRAAGHAGGTAERDQDDVGVLGEEYFSTPASLFFDDGIAARSASVDRLLQIVDAVRYSELAMLWGRCWPPWPLVAQLLRQLGEGPRAAPRAPSSGPAYRRP